VKDLLPLFLAANPDFVERFYINVELAANAGAHILAVNTGNPDIFVADVDYAMDFAALDKTATIAQLGIEINEDDYYEYVIDLMRRGDDIMGLTHQATPGGMIYRADIAKEVLGIESEEDMQALVSTWDGFLEVAEQIVEETDLAMMYAADELKRNFLNTRNQGWVNDNGVFVICEETITEFVRVTGAIQEMGGLRNNATGQWSDDWHEARGDGDLAAFAFFGSTWYLHWIHRGRTQQFGTYGQWGMVPGPAPFFWGGTYWFGSTEAAACEDKSSAVRDIIEFFCVDEESVEAFARSTGDFVSNRNVVNRIKDDDDFNNTLFLFGTNHYQVFAEIAETINITDNVTRFDAAMDEIFGEFITDVFASNMALNDAMTKMRQSVHARIPDITVVQ
jgi:ABC-type glycerol-3-phosphate transport system substrate-binding protein